MKTTENKQAIYDFLKGLNVDNLYVTDYINLSDIDEYTTFESLTEILSDKNAFEIEIIYYSNAIKYLSENDPSLRVSLEIAQEYGFTCGDLSSEVLASLHASRKCSEDWHALSSEIEDFLNEIDWDDENN